MTRKTLVHLLRHLSPLNICDTCVTENFDDAKKSLLRANRLEKRDVRV